VTRWQVGDVTITAVVELEHELLVPQDGQTTATVLANDWLAPFRMPDGVLRVTTSAIVLRGDGPLVVVDPWTALDGPERAAADQRARYQRRFDALAAAGVKPDGVDAVVNTHLDGVGSNTVPDFDGEERAAFPNATYYVPRAELAALAAGERPGEVAMNAVHERTTAVDAPLALDGEISIIPARGHRPDHTAVRVASRGESAYLIGHMFLHPAQMLDPGASLLDEDPATNHRTRLEFLERCEAEHARLIAPLFAPPGGGYVERAGTGWRLTT